MRHLMAWSVLIAVFLFAGWGLNLFREAMERWLAFGHAADLIWMVAGLAAAFAGTAFLGGFVYYRDKKRNKLTREGWRGRPVQRRKRPEQG
ncbi:DUF2627 family protein [Alicyclobacillus macrosporangiidus]|uniref:DUF2627 family protein n=1 Tax=Alicyclobacillus macrosporangiidus TaxID=392015 RepID=UPI0004958594|nr:DUF2627 family protein [Alicyclobacillus macrosporangiidus]MCL6597962.1 DUF2627 domain-containing protein [Alicyclobacillus macrosporangiidus]